MKKSTKSALETQKFAADLAKNIVSLREIPRRGTKRETPSGALVIALAGELGSGKTTFAQGFAQGLGVKEKILSPTFILIRCYKLSPYGGSPEGRQTKNYKLFYHIDCYRLDSPAKELLHLGFKKIITDPRNIVVIEWADRVKPLLPPNTIWFYFAHAGKGLTRRSIVID